MSETTSRSEVCHTFVFADLAGFTALTEAHGDDAAAACAASFVDGMRAVIAAYPASEVKTLGDAVMLHLTDAAEAVALCADAVAHLGLRHGQLGLRIGINTGSAVRRGDDWYGAAVNIAARVCELAPIDAVLLTGATVAFAGAGLTDRHLEDLGAHRLRHVGRPVHLFALEPTGRRLEGRCPVCLMGVADHALSVDGVRFCSPSCAEIFRRDPATYTDRLDPDPRLARFSSSRDLIPPGGTC